MAKPVFTLGGVPISIPVDPDDMLWFAQSLKTRGVDVRVQISSSIVAARDLAMAVMPAHFLAAQLPEGLHVRATLGAPSFDLGEAAAMVTLIRGLRRTLSPHPELLDSAWKRLASGSPLALPRPRAEARDHIWELVNAGVFCSFARHVHLNADDDGVDLRGSVNDEAWGIECKVLYTEKKQRHVDRIVYGAKQLENDRRVSKGVIALNVTSCFDHTPFHASLGASGAGFLRPEEVKDTLAASVRALAKATLTRTLRQRLGADKHGRRRHKWRALIFVGQTVAKSAHKVRVFTAQVTVPRDSPDRAGHMFGDSYHGGWARLQAEP